jgi:hypothetical protein
LPALGIQITDREVERLWDYYRLLLRGLSQADFDLVSRWLTTRAW